VALHDGVVKKYNGDGGKRFHLGDKTEGPGRALLKGLKVVYTRRRICLGVQ
jgi:hypothetical protein